ncbi:MAG: phage tail length tape measure family protein [Rhizobiales bacterium]|nr:phage tail length tape measure family protein [Hyphomicrobiales bacterium]
MFGFSVKEAREFTNALASTGRIGRENIEPIVQAGHDVARVLGVDATEAAQILAKAFSDPVKGAEDLNSRLGFMDAAMQRQITSLMAQNRVYQAQRILLDGILQSTRDSGIQVSTTTKFWTAFGNAISNAWDKFGEGASRLTGIGFTESLDEQIERTKARIAELEQIASRRSDAVNKALGTSNALDQERAKLEQLTGAWNRYWQSVEQAQQKRDSFAQRALVVQQLPEIDVRQNLQDQQVGLELLRKGIEATGGANSEVLRRMNVSWDEFTEALARARSQYANFRTDFEKSLVQQDTALRSLTAFSPSARGEIAYAQRFQAEIDRGTEATKAATLAERDRQIAIKSITVAISEQARERQLAAEQAVASANLEISLIGKSVGEQARLRADLQMRQQMEQESARNRTAFDEAEFARLQKINAELGRKVQLRAQADLTNQLQFERSQLGMTDTEANIASRLRSVYGDDLSSAAAQSAAAMMRVNEQLKQTRDLSMEFVSGFASDLRNGLRNGEDFWDAFAKAGMNAINRLADRLMDIALQNLLFKAFGNLLGGWTGGVPLAGGAAIGQGGIGHAHTGGTIGQTGFMSRYIHPAYFDDAPRYHTGLDMGPIGGLAPDERPIIGRVGERVVTPEQWAEHTGGVTISMPAVYNIAQGADPRAIAEVKALHMKLVQELPVRIVQGVRDAQSRRMFN